MAVKEAVFPFARFPGVDTVLGPEMRSTGEVMGLDWRRPGEPASAAFARAFAKAQLGGGTVLPASGAVFVSVKPADKPFILEPARILSRLGFTLVCTTGTAAYLEGEGLKVERVKKVLEGRPNIVDRIKDGGVQLVFNTTEGRQSLEDSFSLRRNAPDVQGALLHHRRRRPGRRPGHRRGQLRRAGGAPAAELRVMGRRPDPHGRRQRSSLRTWRPKPADSTLAANLSSAVTMGAPVVMASAR